MIFGARSSWAVPQCPDREKVVAVNIAFAYFTPKQIATRLLGEAGSQEFLPETKEDLKLYNQMTKKFAGSTYEVTDEAPAAETRQVFLSKLKEWTASADAIHLNYSGHGVVTENGEWAIALPNFNSKECAGEKVPAHEIKELAAKRGLSTKLYRGSFGESFVKEVRGLNETKTVKTLIVPDSEKTRQALRDVKATLTTIQTVKDSGQCAKYLVPVSEIQNAVGDKNVYGIFDSCYAGAIHNTSNIAALSPVSDTQEAYATEAGGFMTAKIRQNLSLLNCRHSGKKATIEDLYANSAKTVSSTEIKSREGDMLEKFELVKQGSSPTISTNSGSECFDYSQPEVDLKCPVPTKLKMKTAGKTFKPYAGLGEELASCEMNREEDIDPKTIDSSICPPRILLVGQSSQCTGWVRLSALTGKEVKCAGAPSRTPAKPGSSTPVSR